MIKFNQELYNRCYEKASQCSTCLEFSQKYGAEFYHSVRNWFIKKFTWLKDPDIFEWSEEAIYESCKKYKRFSAWKSDNNDIYGGAKKLGILDKLPLNRSQRYKFLHSDIYRESLKYIDLEATEKLLGYKLEDADKKDITVICKLINGERIEYNYDHLIRKIKRKFSKKEYIFEEYMIPGYNDTYTLYPGIRKFEDRETNLKNGIDLGKIKPGTHGIRINVFVDGRSIEVDLNRIIEYLKKDPNYTQKKIIRVITGFNDLMTEDPVFVEKFWDYEKNNKIGIFPDQIKRYSNKKVYFKCGICGKSVDKPRKLYSLTYKCITPMCSDCHNKLQTSYPEQAIFLFLKRIIQDIENGVIINGRELDIYSKSLNFSIEYDGWRWHDNAELLKRDNEKYEMMKDEFPNLKFIRIIDRLTKRKYIPKADFIYEFNENKINDNVFKELFSRISKDTGLNFDIDKMNINLSSDQYIIMENIRKCVRENSFGNRFPDYLKYWDYDKNGTISPYEISYRSNYKFWFKCDYEGKTYSYQKIPNNLNSGKSILPVELIRKIQPNNNNPCISYEISSGKITEYQSVGVMNNTLNMNLYRNTKGRNNHFSIDGKYLVFFKSDFSDENVKKMLDRGPIQVKTR